MRYTLWNEDNLAVLRRLPDNSVDSVVTDPPYGLGKEPDAVAMLRDWLDTGHHDVAGKGFMGKAWDSFVPQPAQWREVYRVLKPGGHVLCFAGTRTQDLMALGLRIAGFEIRDLIAWVYGSGFPKSLDVSKAIDKAQGATREKVKPRSVINHQRQLGNHRPYMDDPDHTTDSDVPASAAAAAWQGWGTALKPSLEPVTLARKPLIGTVAENVLGHGTGALNIDGCRVGTDENLYGGAYAKSGARGSLTSDERKGAAAGMFQPNKTVGLPFVQPKGRWPANFIHDGSEEVVWLFPETASGKPGTRRKPHQTGSMSGTLNLTGKVESGLGDAGSASRFFYCAKTNASDRNEGCDGLPDKQWVTENTCIPERDNRPFNPSKNDHPTVKPTALMRYLVRLVTPPGGTVLDPWMGSGSTGKACAPEGFSFIGIDSDKSHGYFAIAQARVKAAYPQPEEEDWC